MAVTVTLSSENQDPSVFDCTKGAFIVKANLVLSGNYATHGDTVDLSQLGIPTQSLPRYVFIYEEPPAGTSPTGYIFTYCPGTTLANGVMTVFNNLSEFSSGAYSAGLLAAVLRARIEIRSFA